MIQRDRLAVSPSFMIRSDVLTVDTETKLLRAKDRLYVLCQVAGWGGLTGLNLFYLRATAGGNPGTGRDPFVENAIFVMIMLQGWLLSHFLRWPIHRWGWKSLGWAALLPRLMGMSILSSLLWSLLGFGYIYLVLQYPWTSKLSPTFGVLATTINGSLVLGGWLCVYFIYHAFERLRHMQIEQFRLATSVKEAELRALKSQINPHFLFNSLNSLRALIDEDAPRARESVTRLANLLRYSLQSGQLETVTLEEEIRIVEDYLALELIRHENRLRIRWMVTDEARTRSVPPMLLQTLVENAVKYGISTHRDGGEVTIRASIAGTDLHVSVTNPGEVTPPTSQAAARAGSSTGVGLRNASERLKLLFGDRARLTLATESVGSVTAHVMIPFKSTP